MKISELPYYVKFVFLCENDTGYSTADFNLLSLIQDANSGKRIYALEVGQRLIFEPQSDKIYRVTSIAVKHLFEDTKDMLLGIDLEDCPMQGDAKEWLLKILVRMELEK